MVGQLAFRASLPRTGTTSRDAWHDLREWLPARCGPSASEDALLLTAELVTNAVVHTRSAEVAVRARCDGRTLLVAVDDEDSGPPASDGCSGGAIGGGLTLLEALALQWGWEPLIKGKRVWFEVPCADQAFEANGAEPRPPTR
jgi:hypothetical protein